MKSRQLLTPGKIQSCLEKEMSQHTYNSAVGIYMDIMKPIGNTDRTNNHDITKLEDGKSVFVCVRTRVREREREGHRQTERQRETDSFACVCQLVGPECVRTKLSSQQKNSKTMLLTNMEAK